MVVGASHDEPGDGARVEALREPTEEKSLNPYALLPLLGAFVALLFGLMTYFHDRRDFSNKLFLWVSFMVAYLSFDLFAFRQVDSADAAWAWIRAQFLWPFLFVAVYHHTLAFSKTTGPLRSRPLLAAIYTSALAISLISLFTHILSPGPEKQWWGWSPAIPDGSVLLHLIAAWVLGLLIASFAIVAVQGARSADRRFRAQAKFLILGYSLPLATLTIINIVLPLSGISVPDMSPPVFALGAGFFAYGLIRHQLFVLTPRAVSQEILETMSDAVLLVDPRDRVVSVNTAATRLLELARTEIIDRPLAAFLPAHSLATDEAALTTGAGRTIDVSLAITPLKHDDGTGAGAVIVVRDISERKRMEARVARLEGRRREQALREAKEGERKRLAEELHDQTLMELAGLAIEVGFAERESAGDEAAEARLRVIRSRVHSAESGLRDILKGLYPDVLTNLGLIAAIRSFLDALVALPLDGASPVTIHLKSRGFGDRRPDELAEITAYRFVQQSTFNAVRHSNATRIDVALRWAGTTIEIEVTDDGVGFEPSDVELLRSRGSHGLANLYERVEAVGGRIEIISAHGEGTRVRTQIPSGDVLGEAGHEETATYTNQSKG